MRMNDNFNIITGEVKHNYPQINQSRRFASLQTMRKYKEDKTRPNTDQLPPFNLRTLGTPQDSKFYQYSYLQGKKRALKVDDTISTMGKKHSEPISLINATRAEFNLINHSVNHDINPNWSMTKKRNPVSKMADLGRINALHFTQAYKENPNFGKKMSLCTTICEIQRSYGTDKFFRKYK